MSSAAPPKVYTTEDLLAMPDDGVERWIIRGQLREKPPEVPGVTMTVRNRHHSQIMSFVAAALVNWARTQPLPRGGVYCGEVGLRLPVSPATTVGADVVYAPPDVVAVQSDDETTLLEGVPTLVVEILSPNDTQEQVTEKIREYLTAGVPLVWIIDPDWRTVRIHRPAGPLSTFNDTERVAEDGLLPGFTPAVSEFFD